MKILLAYDGSENSDAAIDDLQFAGLPEKSEATVLSVADVLVPPTSRRTHEAAVAPSIVVGVRTAQQRAQSALDEARSLSERAHDRLQKLFPTWAITAEACADSPAWAVIKKADEWEPDVVVVGAKGHSVLGGRLILGSVSQRVLYEARCSVRIGRHTRKSAEDPIKILIGVDGSTYSEATVATVARRPWPSGTQVFLLAVVDTVMSMPADAGSNEPKWIEVSDEKDWDEVRKLFALSLHTLRRAGVDADLMIRRGDAAQEIVEQAESWGADSIFLGAKGVRGIERVLMGSVSSSVAARAHCSVEVVRP